MFIANNVNIQDSNESDTILAFSFLRGSIYIYMNKYIYREISGEGHGNPLQYSWLENPMDRGAWWAIVHGVTKNRT